MNVIAWMSVNPVRRAASMLLCAWIATVVGAAAHAAYSDQLELYRWTALGLLLIGVPVGVASAAVFFSLAGRKWTIALVTIATLAFLAMLGNSIILENDRRIEQERRQVISKFRLSVAAGARFEQHSQRERERIRAAAKAASNPFINPALALRERTRIRVAREAEVAASLAADGVDLD